MISKYKKLIKKKYKNKANKIYNNKIQIKMKWSLMIIQLY